MTISTQQSSEVFLGNGATTVFNFNFVADSAANIAVIYTDVNGNQTTLLPSQYILAINAAATGQQWGAGGNVTYPIAGSPIASGTSITIQRTIPLQQLVTIANQGSFSPEVIEEGLDVLEMQLQQVAARTGQFRGTWATNTNYNFGDYVVDGANGTNTGNYYMCFISNTSAVWSTDLSAGDWVLVINVVTLAAYSTAAAASAASASSSASSASSSATNANASATSAATSATSATASASQAAASAASAAASAASITDVSSTSNTIGTGTKTFTVSAGKSFAAGMYLVVTDQANASNYMHGSVNSYSGTTLVMNIIDTGGSGTKSAWNITPSTPGALNAGGTTGQVQVNTSGVLTGITAVNSAVMVTSAGGVASFSTALPNGVTTTTQAGGDSSTKLASTAFVASAIANVAYLNVAQSFTKSQGATPVAVSSSSNSTAFDFSASNNFSTALTENTTFANPSNIVAGKTYNIDIVNGVGPYTVAYGSYFKFPGGNVPTVTATNGASDLLVCYAKTTIFLECSLIKGFA